MNAHRFLINWILTVLCVVSVTVSGSNTKAAEEYELKAVFLYNFANFVIWPEAVFKSPTDPLSICVLGENPFGDFLNIASQGKKSHGHSLEDKHIQNVTEIGSCHILFISRSEQNRLYEIANFTKRSAVLTVSDIEGFAEQGGMIEFFELDRKIKFSINLCAFKQANLKAAADLLRLAKLTQECH